MLEWSGKSATARAGREPFDGISWRGVYGRGWRRFFRDLWHEIVEDRVFDGAATVAFYLTFAVFPGLIFLLSLLPYLPLPNLRDSVIDGLFTILPVDTAKLLQDTVEGVVARRHHGLVSLGALLTIWAASSGSYTLMQQLNFTYDITEGRSYLRVRLQACALVLGFGVFTVLAFVVILAGNALEHHFAALPWWRPLFTAGYELVRWLFTLCALAAAFSLTYYFGPDVEQEFRFITPGSLLAVVFFLGASLLFKAYVAHFGYYNATYGSLGAMMVLMLWLNLFGLVTLLGSEVNALLEHYAPVGKRKGEKRAQSRAA